MASKTNVTGKSKVRAKVVGTCGAEHFLQRVKRWPKTWAWWCDKCVGYSEKAAVVYHEIGGKK